MQRGAAMEHALLEPHAAAGPDPIVISDFQNAEVSHGQPCWVDMSLAMPPSIMINLNGHELAPSQGRRARHTTAYARCPPCAVLRTGVAGHAGTDLSSNFRHGCARCRKPTPYFNRRLSIMYAVCTVHLPRHTGRNDTEMCPVAGPRVHTY